MNCTGKGGARAATGGAMIMPEMSSEEPLEQPDQIAHGLGTPEAAQEPSIVPDHTAGPAPSEPESGFDSADEFRETPALPFPVVAIGSSAGGLEPCLELFGKLDPDTGMAFVVLSHMAPHQPSMLVEILARHTQMPVSTIRLDVAPEPNHVYVLPPGQRVFLHRGVFHLESRTQADRSFMPIDDFFRSLAVDQKYRAVGVVLSGADADGALGLRTIKGEGGVAIVQQPETARFPHMPRSSIAADHVDLVVPPAGIAAELERIGTSFRTFVPLIEEAPAPTPSTEAQEYHRIINALRGVSGIDFRLYKQSTIRRRIARRLMLKRMGGIPEYARYLVSHPEEIRELHEDILINVTRFFRDPEVFHALREDLLPRLLVNRDSDQQLRIWIAGCSTGEEVYSIAMTLLEYISAQQFEPPIQIFGTDASETSVARARAAIYPESIAADVSPERLRRFFTKTDQGYQVTKRVRDLCIFARQNLCNDPPFSRLDLISCRNVMIYLGPELQKQILPMFHYALRPTGFLVLGRSETIRDHDDLFVAADRRFKFYARNMAHSTHLQGLPARFTVHPLESVQQAASRSREGWTDLDLQRAVDRILLARYGPPGFVVNERMEILQSRGHTAPYVSMAPGAASLHLLRMVRESLTAPVQDAMRRAMENEAPVRMDRIKFRDADAEGEVTIEVYPIQALPGSARCYLLLFSPSLKTELLASPVDPYDPIPPLEEGAVVARLRNDLSATKLYLESLLEERDAKNQELISANEEIQSANEELQSTNEELETTKEELQSANEELQTINDELQQRAAVLAQTSNDLSNLLNSVNIPVLMLSNALEVRHFTPPMQRLINIRAGDIGRPLREIRLNLDVEDIEPLLQEVLDTLGSRELEVRDREGAWLLLRARPYRTTDNKIEGVVLVLVDIDEIRRSRQAMEQARNLANMLIEGVPAALAVVDSDLRIKSVNAAFRDLTGMESEDLMRRSFPELAQSLWAFPSLREQLAAMFHPDRTSAILSLEHETNEPTPRVLRLNSRMLKPDSEDVMLITVEDISAHRHAERIFEQSKQRLERQVDSALRALSKTSDELRALTANLFTTQEEERRRIARELHDSVSQQIAVIGLELTRAGDMPELERVREVLARLSDLTDHLSDDVTRISHGLHPAVLDQLGLPTALRGLLDDFGRTEKMPVTFVEREVPAGIPTIVAGTLFRIAQEALRNVAKHAGPTHVKLTLEGCPEGMRMIVADFGEGFDDSAAVPGLGLLSMKERARLIQGEITVRSKPHEGTTVTVVVPLEFGK